MPKVEMPRNRGKKGPDSKQRHREKTVFSLKAMARPSPSPWSQLTALKTENLAVTDFLHVLRGCPRLRKCTVYTYAGEHEPPAFPVLVHSALEELHLSHVMGQFVHCLELPSLRTLSLGGAISNATHFLPFLARSAASLREFVFRRYGVAQVEGPPLQWFHIRENIVSVKLDDLPDETSRPFLLALDRTVDMGFLPRLRSLHINCDTHRVDAAVVHALQSRYTECDGAKLEVLRLVRIFYDRIHWDRMGEIDWDSLWDLGRSGMDIHVGSPEKNFLWDW
ncbi:hypothetical protein B0H15DRAFT_797817 [Mycena belliarum]|uniref:Uncharacterized protein n=1 Tax=Mycena belliarum TaxID=1033014 RepID=A0AAD6XST5_9AGAR|nr:hypothetical protein B0H15DRAFT_797817 [Mycena belliae]